jgi:hypothetical protein
MRIIEITPADSARWEAFVESSEKTIAWHGYSWSQAVGQNYSYDFHPLAVEDGGVVCGVLPLYNLRNTKTPSPLISVPFAVAGGVAARDESAGQMLVDAGIELARKLGASGLTLKQYRYPAPGDLMTDANYFNRELSLSPGVPGIWEQLEPHNREAIEAAEKDDLVLEFPSRRLDDFYSLLLLFLTQSGLPCPNRRWIQSLLDLGLYSLALLSRKGRIVAATMTKTFKTTVSFPYTCMGDGSQPFVNCTYALYWRLIQHFAENGYTIFHSGRMPNSEDVPLYRRGWGGVKHAYYYQYYPKTTSLTEYGVKRGWKRNLFTSAWKHLPLSLAGAIGPRIVAKFP